MGKFGFYSDKSEAMSFESHLTGLQEQTKLLLLELRSFVKSLGENIIEEVRPHRIVYAKSLTFRTFLDIQPRNDCLTVSIKKGRNEPETTYTMKTSQEMENVRQKIAAAYETIK
jgi:hypothetical protein